MDELRNSVSGKVKVLSEAELIELFDPTVRVALQAKLADPQVEHIVVYECLQMDSSSFGARTALVVGPTWTYRTLAEAAAGRLGDVPSRFQYPVAVWSRA